MTEPVPGRSARKRATILSAGRTLFLSNGYQGTSVDQIAASAEVSKQTVYKHFGDKQELLLAIVNDALDGTVTPFLDRIAELADTDRPGSRPDRAGRRLSARGAAGARRAVAPAGGGEANRVPALAQLYYEQAPARALAAFADCFGRTARPRPVAGTRTRRCRRAFRVPRCRQVYRPGAVLRRAAGAGGRRRRPLRPRGRPGVSGRLSSTPGIGSGVDAVVGLLDGVRARGAFVLRMMMDPPWSMSIRDEAPLTLICQTHGSAAIVGESSGTVWLHPGDVALTRGTEHYVFADDPATTPMIVIHPETAAPHCPARP